MGQQGESKLSRKIMAELRAEGYFVFKIHGGPTMMAGLPDIICCAHGLFIGLETKRPETREHTSARQDYIHSAIRQAQGVAVVVTSAKEALQIVREAVDNATR